MLKHVAEFAVPLAPLVLAQAGFTGNELLVWMGIAAFLLMIFNGAVTAWNSLTGRLKEIPSPSKTYQTLGMCKVLHDNTDKKQAELQTYFGNRISGLARKMDDVQAETKEDLSALRDEMHKDLEGINRSIGRLEGPANAAPRG